MNPRTVFELNRINLDFYRRQAESFSQSRGKPWRGWDRVLAQLPARASQSTLSVLDVGCGNGRFGAYLEQHLGDPFSYQGLDASSALLLCARERLKQPDVQLVEHDLVPSLVNDSPPEEFRPVHDLVVVFGLLHHIPGNACRDRLVRWCCQSLKPGGVVALACWQFGARERFIDKIVPWEQAAERYEIAPSELEPGDYLLGWRGSGDLRYCHFVKDEQLQTWARLSGVRSFDRFAADGRSGDLNAYLLLQRSHE